MVTSSELDKLKNTKTRKDLAVLLGFELKYLTYILYKIDPEKKYRAFPIPKKNGGERIIHAPYPQLNLLQKRLSELLTECVDKIKENNPKYWKASHGFQPKRTIVSNAAKHKRRKFVFNIDIEDFFGSINFGRVRGFFIHDRYFSLKPEIATLIAQIACHKNALPQGSPCSPIISNLIGNILDIRLSRLAHEVKCTYTRYADDLTFSTHQNFFPAEIAQNPQGAEWIIGKILKEEIERAGFKLNPKKTRMSQNYFRQTVTGLIVNTKVNIDQDYYRTVRAMCHSLFQKGTYFKPADGVEKVLKNTNPLEGMLSYIYFVKARRDRTKEINKWG